METNILRIKKLSHIPKIFSGFSTRSFGSMRPDDAGSDKALGFYAASLGVDPKRIVAMQQVHSNHVRWVDGTDIGQRVLDTDGILTKDVNLCLTVLSADCLPILFYDPIKKYVGAVHAGWRGIYSEIIKTTIYELKAKGSNPKDINIIIGPCIRSCCYAVSPERADLFVKKFHAYTRRVLVKRRGEFVFLDLPSIAKQQIVSEGVLLQNIEDYNICTADTIDTYYSFRKEGKNFGEFIGIIGLL